MLAELAGLDRKSAGRVLVATIAANVDDIGSTTTTPWRVMSWEPRAEAAPHLVDGEVTELRADLEARAGHARQAARLHRARDRQAALIPATLGRLARSSLARRRD